MSPATGRSSPRPKSLRACWPCAATSVACSIRPAATARFRRGCRTAWRSSSMPPIARRRRSTSISSPIPSARQFATVIGNPPYVKARDILPETAVRLGSSLLDGHANLYLHFIEKCVRHLQPGGELILITPRDFLKATGAGAAQHLAVRSGHHHRFRGSRRREGLRRRRAQLRHLALRERQRQPSPARRAAHGARPAAS